MKVMVFSASRSDEAMFSSIETQHQFEFTSAHLNHQTVRMAEGCQGISAFVNDTLDEAVIKDLAEMGVEFIALRCAGYNNVDVPAVHKHRLKVARVPAYSPHAVAEHATALLLCLNRHLHRAFNRVRDGNFLLEGLLGFDLAGKTVGVVGTGNIGRVFCQHMKGFGCRILAFDVAENPECTALGAEYKPLEVVLAESDIISLHCPLLPQTHHMINENTLSTMKDGVFIINTSRGGLIDAQAAIDALKSKKIGGLALDVYEEETDYFFEDLSSSLIADDVLARLMTFPNVLITGHQGFFTEEAVREIVQTTLTNLDQFEQHQRCDNEIAS